MHLVQLKLTSHLKKFNINKHILISKMIKLKSCVQGLCTYTSEQNKSKTKLELVASIEE